MDSFDRQWQRWFPEDKVKNPEPPKPPSNRSTGFALLILGILFILFIILGTAKDLYSDWLWFTSLNYGSVYTTVFKARVLIFLVAAVTFGIIFIGNVWLASRLVPKTTARYWPWEIVRWLQTVFRRAVVVTTAVLSVIFGLVAQSQWDTILRFFNRQPFGVNDPVFHKEVSFYVFSLPYLDLLQGWLLWAAFVTLGACSIVYVLSYGLQWFRLHLTRPVLAHVSGLIIAILALFAWSYWLNIWELVFSTRGVVFGATYSDLHAKLPAMWILIVIVFVSIAVILASIWRRNFRWPLYALGGWLVAAVLIGNVYPAFIQRFQVEPDELNKETPYINNNIGFTRQAFALDRIAEQPFPAEDTPSPQDIAQNAQTVNNIRLWDPRPLKDTYNQIQSIRLYYDFNDVDVDRYTIGGQYRQVMLSVRELSPEKLAGQAQTWVNLKLQYTHGYGAVVSPVNEITSQGLPDLLLQDIPPAGNFTLTQPQVYFGEKTNHYIMVKTKTQEFDYPSGQDNVFGFYKGTDGVGVGNLFRRFIYAWELGDFNILISNQLTAQSKVLYYRNIQDRVSHLAPFLTLDKDPYAVLIDGKIFWIQDAYTSTGRYPYSTPDTSGINYIRNSVKAVIDAYNGTVTFYVSDPTDAVIRTYQSMFPNLFVPMGQMAESLQAHLRYPEDMFVIQAHAYRSYHMQDARVFYNKEDLWAVPNELYFGTEQAMAPYFIIMRLPGEQNEEFLLMLPFTPVNKNNAIGWLAARSDGANYGKLLAYMFPKDKLVYGPSQVENRIGQDTTITSQFSLWSQGGSVVIRGNLLLIPLAKSMLYVEPVFLQAQSGGLPELKRVIVTTGDQISMQPSLAEALSAIFGNQPAPTTPASPGVTPPGTIPPPTGGTVNPTITGLVNQAQQHYNQALADQKAGDWAGYGKEIAALQAVLQQLSDLTAGK